jgi:glycogen debranching enzyme
MSFPKNVMQIDDQFGNLLSVRNRRTELIGISEVFIASLIQFQPLAEIDIFSENGEPVQLKEIRKSKDPVARCRTFDGGSFLMHEKSVVDGDNVGYQLQFVLKPTNVADCKLKLKLSGALLFSPQGVPYHWQKEKMVTARFCNEKEVRFVWMDQLLMQISSSLPLQKGLLHSLNEEQIKKSLYFETHNIKKRYTYWTDKSLRTLARDQTVKQDCLVARNIVYCGEVDVELNKNEPFNYTLNFAVDYEGENTGGAAERSIKIPAGIEEFAKQRSRHLNDFFAQVPKFSAADHCLEDAYYRSWFVLFSNQLQLKEERFKYPFTSVNKFHYYNQFFWDSAFQSLAWLWFNQPEPAESEQKNFVLNQWNNGMIPYELFIFSVNGREWMETDFKTTAATQPPVIAISLLEIYKKFGNKSLLSFFYEPLLKYEQWLWNYRDLGKRGLSYLYHIWESGTDNSPKFDRITRNRLLDPALESVDFNVFVYLLRKALIEIAGILGFTPPDYLAERMEKTKLAMNSLMLEPVDSFYYDIYAGGTEKVRVKTFSGILPLITDIPEPATRKALTDLYLLSETEFNTPCPVATVSRSESSFGSNDFWRGANWPQITWSFVYGVKPYCPTAAALILDKYLSVSASKSLCNEYCDSVNGDGVGLAFQGWGTLYIDLIIRQVVGIEPFLRGFYFNPLTTRYQDFAIQNIMIHGLNLAITRKAEEWQFSFNQTAQLTLKKTISFTLTKEDNRLIVVFDDGVDWDQVIIKNASFQKKTATSIQIVNCC